MTPNIWLLSIDIIDGNYDYEAPSDGLDIRITKSGSGLNSLGTFENGSSVRKPYKLFIWISQQSTQNGKLSPKLFEDRWQPGTWVLKVSIFRTALKKLKHIKKQTSRELGNLFHYYFWVEDNDSPKLLGLVGDRNLIFMGCSWSILPELLFANIWDRGKKAGDDSWCEFRDQR